MYRSTLILSFICLALTGCWDFEALTDKGARNADGGPTVDLYSCSTMKTSAREDCENGTDDNEDCLVDCEDPQCKDYIKCLDPTNQLIGYGTRNPTTFTCGGNQTATPINQNLSLNADCGAGCGCQTNAAACTSMLHWAADMTLCNAGTFVGNAALSSGTTGNQCVATTNPNPVNSSVFKVDAITSSCPRDTTKNGTLTVAWGTQEKLCTVKGTCDTLDCVKRAGHVCLAFTGDFATCPADFPTKVNTWFQTVTDARQCTCTCASQTGSCAVVNPTDAQLSDSGTCAGGAKTQNITQAQVNTCVAAALSGGNPPAVAFSYTPRPVCAAAGVASTNLASEMSAGRVTLNSPVTTCCTP